MSNSLVERYLAEMGEIIATHDHVAETSFYWGLATMLTDIGRTLSPKVRCVINPSNRGAGLPDGGLYSADQFRRKAGGVRDEDGPLAGQIPSRGVIEAKPPSVDVLKLAASEQVGRYWERYGMVLATNFRAFALVGKDSAGKPRILESFSLADTEAEFRHLAAHPRQAAAALGDRLVEYLKRVMLHNAPLAAPQDVAEILASYAHDARLRMEHAEIPALAGLRQALEEALGLKFEGEKGEHFFRSTLVQTLFYGLFSAWVFWARRREAKASEKPAFAQAVKASESSWILSDKFDWHTAQWLLRVPMLRALFVQIADPDRLGAIGLIEVLDWAAAALNRVDRKAFFALFSEGHAIQYFYEPFLQAYDPDLRKELGVWYTPVEIVRYQVERVDTVLRSELGLADGLADPNVVVLDPCCGTGTYLRAVLHRIAETLRDKGGDALVAQDLKKAAMERVFGFEILPAPFVISHLQLGLELESLGAPLADRGDPPERVGVYLTNALTGWEPPQKPKTKILFPEMEQERDAADHIKRSERILVILGNPPYNGFSGIAVEEERDLSTAYRTSKKVAPPKGQGLNDLYVRFFRMAERRIVELNQPARGVVCFISNYSWLDGLSFTGMRERYLEVFDKIWIDCLNGDKYKTGKLTPEGEPDPSVFSTQFNREGIQVGTAIALLVRHAKHVPRGDIKFRNHWGKAKKEKLSVGLLKYDCHKPACELGLSLMPGKVDSGYLAWPLIPDLFPASFPGAKTARDGSLVAIEEAALRKRMEASFDPKLTNSALMSLVPELMEDDARFDAAKTRDYLLKRGINKSGFVKYYYRPYDVRWLYWDPETKLLDEKRSEYFSQVAPNNPCMVLAQRTRKGFFPPIVTSSIVSYHVIESVSLAFTLFVEQPNATLLSGAGSKPNISDQAADYVSALEAKNHQLFFHSVAVMHSPSYQAQNSGALGQDWPRIPLPKKKEALLASAELGRQIAALLDPESPFDGLTNGKLRHDLKEIAVFERLDGKSAKPERGDLDVTAGWGHAGKGGVTMPGRGKTEVREGGAVDVFLNDQACWRNIPESVWEYTIGGYQVIKKWLSYRERPLLGRGLTSKEVRYVTEMVRRISVLVSMHKDLDENYRAVIKSTYAWPKK